MSEFTPAQTQRMVCMLAGEMTAMRTLVATLIASHPRPDLVRKLWDSSKPDWVDLQVEQKIFSLPDFKEAYLKTMGAMSQSIEEAESIHGLGGPSAAAQP